MSFYYTEILLSYCFELIPSPLNYAQGELSGDSSWVAQLRSVTPAAERLWALSSLRLEPPASRPCDVKPVLCPAGLPA